MPITTADKRATFRKMHESGCFVLPNPFDVGSAKALQHLGFKAIASTSAGFAWTIGKADNRVTLEEVCDASHRAVRRGRSARQCRFRGRLCARGRRRSRANVARAVKTGVAGLSIEDSTGDKAKPLYERALAIERIKAARAAIDADNSGVLLTGRCEGFLVGQADLNMVIDRLQAYAEAGADCLYAPGIKTREQISAVVKAVHPKPVNLLHRVRPACRSRKPPISASAASASAVRWRARRGAASCARRARWRRREPSPSSPTAIPAAS